MKVPIDAFLWRNANTATVDTLIGESRGQYDIRLSSTDFTEFFKGLTQTNHTNLGGFEIAVPVAEFDGPMSAATQELIIRFMGKDSARKDWYIRAQRPDTAYDLWRHKRGFTSSNSVGPNDYLILARDIHKKYHARWIRSADFKDLPDRMKTNIKPNQAGWCEL